MQEKVIPRILPGFMELLPAEQILFNDMYDTIRGVYESFGFLPLNTPVIPRYCSQRPAARRKNRFTASKKATAICPFASI